MRVASSVGLDAAMRTVRKHVVDLDAYTAWMPIVHRAVAHTDQPATWDVELRAKVGPLARSKRLTMSRTLLDEEESGRSLRAVFERNEADGRRHAPWVLTVSLTCAEGDTSRTRLDMELFYGGTLWTGGILEKVLSDSIDTGKRRLSELVSGS